MMKQQKIWNKFLTLFLTGGFIYYIIEFIYKNIIHPTGSITHWTMIVVGGIVFICIGAINEYIPWEMSLVKQGLIGTIIATMIELVSGLILNVWLQLGIWNYSNVPMNFIGQICLPFTILWFFISLIAIILDDYLRYWWWDEEKPHYKLI